MNVAVRGPLHLESYVCGSWVQGAKEGATPTSGRKLCTWLRPIVTTRSMRKPASTAGFHGLATPSAAPCPTTLLYRQYGLRQRSHEALLGRWQGDVGPALRNLGLQVPEPS